MFGCWFKRAQQSLLWCPAGNFEAFCGIWTRRQRLEAKLLLTNSKVGHRMEPVHIKPSRAEISPWLAGHESMWECSVRACIYIYIFMSSRTATYMCIYIHSIYICIHIYVFTYSYHTCVYIYTQTYTRTYLGVYIYILTDIRVQMCEHTCVCIYIYMYTCMYTHVLISIYAHTNSCTVCIFEDTWHAYGYTHICLHIRIQIHVHHASYTRHNTSYVFTQYMFISMHALKVDGRTGRSMHPQLRLV